MPRTPRVQKEKVLAALGHDGATCAEVAGRLGIHERTARGYLTALFTSREVARVAEYRGKPPVFHYRYTAAKATRSSTRSKPEKRST